jgi:LPPG:FO 2-phospho-L-lactate transferase
MKVAALAGGVGGAKLADGLAQVLPAGDLTVIVNTADDFDHLGLRISPDLDTLLYTLAGVANPETGWGRSDETWSFLATLESLGGPTWFRLGDRDLAVHMERTRRLTRGDSLASITADFAGRLGVPSRILPMSEDRVATRVQTREGELAFQDYFVARACEPVVTGFRFDGVDGARPLPAALQALQAADLIVVCPSNPWVSIDPILAVAGYRSGMAGRRVVAVSPIVGGSAIKGPAAKMFAELGIQPTALAVAEHYRDWVTDFVLDEIDRPLLGEVQALGLRARVAPTVMRTPQERADLARLVAESLEVALPSEGNA